MHEPGRLREWLYRQLLRSHPADFRREYQAELVATFCEAWRDGARGRGPRRALTFWAQLAVGEIRAGLAARWRRRRGAAPRAPSSLGSDARLAWRSVTRAPGFSGVVVLTLALGIGASTVVYSVVDFALLRPLPYRDAGQLVRVYLAEREDPTQTNAVTGAHYLAYRSASAFASLAAAYTEEPTWLDALSAGAPHRVRALRVSASYFPTLSLVPILGRTFTREDEREGAGVVVLVEHAWRDLYGADPDLLGRTVILDGTAYEVAGVVPSVPTDPVVGRVELYLPQDLTPGGANHADNNYLTVVGRLAPGEQPARAALELALAGRAIEAETPEAARWVPRIVPLHEDLVGRTRPLLLVLLGSVAVVLAIVCVNVGNLFLARAMERRRELAIHAALGCPRATVLRRLLLESLMLAVAGGLLGVLLAHWGVGILPVLLRDVGPSHLWDLAIDRRILGFVLLVAAGTGLAFGALPALRASRADPAVDLAGGRQTGDRGTRRLRDALAVAQVAIALVLITAAALLVVTFERLRQVDIGFDSHGVLTFTVALPAERYDAPARARFHDELAQRMAELTGGVVGAVSRLPATGSDFSWGTGPLTGPLGGDARGWTQANQRVVAGNYFAALRIPLLAGRGFGSEDGPQAPHRFVINLAAAERLFPDTDPVGQQLRVAFLRGEVVGVVGNTAVDLEGSHVLHVYHAHRQFADNRNWLLHYVVTVPDGASPPEGLVPALRTVLAGMDPGLVLFQPQPLAAVVGRGLAERRLALIFLLGFAGTATTLAILGVYAVLAHSMLQRRREIGLRLALGASQRSVRSLVLRRALALGGTGIVLGLPVALAFGRSLEFLLYRVTAADPAILVGVTGLTLAVSVGAAWPTMRRATQVEPATVLREE